MAPPSCDRAGLYPQRNLYVPMADLLAGLVFILIIVLQAVALVAREDFARSDEVLREARRIEERLARLRAIEASEVRPREQLEDTLREVVAAIARDLRARGLRADALPDGRRIAIETPALVGPAGIGPETRAIAAALGETLERWRPCLDLGRPRECPGAGQPELSLLLVMASAPGEGGGEAAGAAAAAALFAEMASLKPGLVTARNRQGASLIDMRGRTGSAHGLELTFAISRPPLPADILDIGPR